MSIQIAVGRQYTIDLGEFGGVPIPNRFLFNNKNPELIELRRGVILPAKIGTASVEIFDSTTGKSTTKIYNIVNPAHLRSMTVPQRGVISRKTDRTHLTIAFFTPLVTERFGQQPLEVAVINDAWSVRLGQDAEWFVLAEPTVKDDDELQPVWPGSTGIIYESPFGTLWLILDPTPPVIRESNVDILSWQRFTDDI